MATDSPQPPSSPPPNKRLKTLSPNFRESMEASDSLTCGICLSENGKAIRGEIDSCDHYFCFVCIMEWAKVESRCPMCKGRFSTIRRPPKEGVFLSERLVHVPVRDQVYHIFGNTTVQPFDPYAEVRCSVCHTAVDEFLLLLCDLCDSAAHTYCVGLGATVPEGDWLCRDCSVSRTQHESIQQDNDDAAQDSNVKADVIVTGEPRVSASDGGLDNQKNVSENYNCGDVNGRNISVFDIVSESGSSFIGKPRARSSVSSPCGRQSNIANGMPQRRERTPQIGSGQQTTESNARTLGRCQQTDESNARTLHRCRNVHGYIQAMRDNWDALRNGSLRFSLSSVDSSSKSIEKRDDLAAASGQQPTNTDGLPGIYAQGTHSHDINKAWKLMSKAKSIQQARQRNNSICCVSKKPLTNASREATGSSSRLHSLRSQQLGSSGLCNITVEKKCRLYSPEKQTEKQMSTKLKMQNQGMIFTKKISGSGGNLQITLPRSSASASSWKTQSSSQSTVYHENQEQLVQKNLRRAALNVSDQKNRSLVGSVSATSESLNSKVDSRRCFHRKVDIPKEDGMLEKGCTDSQVRKDDDAKREIQTLVKLNLNLLNGNKQLGIDAFKEVARLATHTVLAACGFEHSRRVSHPSLRPVCSHSEHIQRLRKSTLMPNSCQECFYVFVKDVVRQVLSEKVCHANSSEVICHANSSEVIL